MTGNNENGALTECTIFYNIWRTKFEEYFCLKEMMVVW